jgi:alginate O-acetyltransferase complex protein AlgJ
VLGRLTSRRSGRRDTHRSAEAGGKGDLLPTHIEAVFREFLERAATPQDIATWMDVGSVRGLIDGVLASDEYAARAGRQSAAHDSVVETQFLNRWSADFERFTRPVGSVSPDGVAIVGAQGHLFLAGGSNDNLAMYRGETPMAQDWLARWGELVNERRRHARLTRRSLCCLVVPDKLAVYADLFPQSLESDSHRPVMRLLADPSLELLYPCEVLREARVREDTYMQTDSHLTCSGNRLLAEVTVEALGVSDTVLEGVSREQAPQLIGGDLGSHFDPPVVEIGSRLLAPSSATIVSDNWPEVSGMGGHIGTQRSFRNAGARDPRTVVIFGDSYGFGDDAYPGLAWFLAQAFKEVHFLWVPFGWDPDYLDRVEASLVVCQTAERFIARVPRTRVDVRSLANALGPQNRALGLETVFGDES